jgi:TetR/AcrR family transcriptional regulator, tetracycline repressor protein
MALSVDTIARTALSQLADVGLDGLTMRVVATALDVQPAALYWHVKNKQELLDVMAATIFADAVAGLEAPRVGESWEHWLADLARAQRTAMLRHRDGAQILAGSNLSEPTLFRATELALRTLQDAGFPIQQAARAVAALTHYTVGFTIEEQAHQSATCVMSHADLVDATRFPLTAQAYVDDGLWDADTDGCFEYGLALILTGMAATNRQPTS